jgi:hypothetical protein
LSSNETAKYAWPLISNGRSTLRPLGATPQYIELLKDVLSTAQVIETGGRIPVNDSLEMMLKEAAAIPEFSGD